MRTEDTVAIHLKDYQPAAYLIRNVDLEFELDPEHTRVRSQLTVARSSDVSAPQPLRLDGDHLKLLSVAIDDEPLDPGSYATDETGLTIFQVPDQFTLSIETEIDPQRNTALEGLFMSKGMFCTQCEAEGVRRITYYLDRPDVMAVFRTRIIAPKASFPVLLSNGNLTGRGDLENGRHWTEWHDPFPKPCYLFALVAGDLACVEDQFTTKSGREVSLKIFVEHGDEHRCDYAMDALKRSMAWDETAYGREYDLNTFMIVAVSHFNMGAMENKGLNIFNSQYILAQPETATDFDYMLIESIIAHEYFHNWTGNRITCRDWFQLCLKEGLTVFRDQQFSADMRSASVQRIKDVRALRFRQFAEDAGPLAHPVRPSTYYKIDNFYTATVYEKGAEIIRMLNILLGQNGFRQGMDVYFDRHDGEAVTIEDFLKCFSDATGRDLSQFYLWYIQPGTPTVTALPDFDAATRRYTLTLRQDFKTDLAGGNKAAMIPVQMAFLDESGVELALPDGPHTDPDSSVVYLNDETVSIQLDGLEAAPHVSLLRHFSAPVKLVNPISHEERAFLIAHDTDDFNRWEQTQIFARDIVTEMIGQIRAGETASCDSRFCQALGALLSDGALDAAFGAEVLALPTEIDLARDMDVIEPELLHQARSLFIDCVARELEDVLLDLYHRHSSDAPYSPSIEQAGPRALKNAALFVLAHSGREDYVSLARDQFYAATNMTNRMAALSAVNNLDHPSRDEMMASFYDQWKHDELVVNKWFRLEAISGRPGTIDRVEQLLAHEAFELTNPNKVRALIGSFAALNQVRFHDPSGRGYALFGNALIKLDGLNPQTAARLTSAFENWKQFDGHRQALMKSQLEAVMSRPNVSKNVLEIAGKILNA